MSVINVKLWAQGVTAMLQHRATEEALTGATRKNTPGEQDDPRVQAERVVYRMEKTRQLYFPGTAFARMLREAGGNHKARGQRKSLKYIVPAAVIVTDEICPMFLNDRKTPITDYEIDARPVTIPATKGRVMRYRPRINEWSIVCNIRIDDSILDEDAVRKLMVEGLRQLGLGDFRPGSGGPFGTSDLVAWDAVAANPTKSVAQIRNSRVA